MKGMNRVMPIREVRCSGFGVQFERGVGTAKPSAFSSHNAHARGAFPFESMPRTRNTEHRTHPTGFTLVEILVALSVMVAAVTIVLMSFSNVVKATQRGEAMLDTLHHGEYTMEQLVSALRSAVFFNNEPDKYEFILEDNGSDSEPADIASWVTSSGAFIPPGSELADSLHRIYVSIEEDRDGMPALAISAHPHRIDPDDDEAEDVDFWIVSRKVRGFNLRVYDEQGDTWEDDYDKKRSLPNFVEITLVVDPNDGETEPRQLHRLVQIPMAQFAKNRSRVANSEANENETVETRPTTPARTIEIPGATR